MIQIALLKVGQKEAHISGILFDKDGTLLDIEALWTPWGDYVLDALEAQLAGMGKSFTGQREQVLGTRYDAQGKVAGYDAEGPFAIATVSESTAVLAWQLYAAGMPWNDAVTCIREISARASDSISKDHAIPLDGLIPFLDRCKAQGLLLGVVTADSTSNAALHLEWLNILDYFDVIIGYDRVTSSKPDPESVHAACIALGLSPEQLAVIGDSNGDMQMGRSAGTQLNIGIVPSGNTSYLKHADIVITHYDQILLKGGQENG
ncbi:HAD family hydrolase [Paenibacillus shunpengii]|uniref:HAD family hydrolase n=1 Tax=Paenibacillus shunpengii TaxID=2054424 RepID=A0ABW5ST78_9BACL|nr:HAD-IA family hydrolase [Paenibacillus sp. FSL H7-0326]